MQPTSESVIPEPSAITTDGPPVVLAATAEAPAVAPSPPVDFERIGALDLIRGVAILGILPANIPWFSGTGSGGFGGPAPDTTLGDYIVKGLTLSFVDAKFITQLAILFGVGLTLQADRAWNAGRRFTWPYLWRTFLLLLLGMIHALLLWFGDILVMYACISLVAVFLVRLRRIGLLVAAGACFTWTSAAIATFVVLALLGGQFTKSEKPPPGVEPTPASMFQGMRDVIWGPADERTETLKRLTDEFRVFMGREHQNHIYREGSYGEQLFDRLIKFVGMMKTTVFFGFGYLLACFMLGAYLVRGGFFSDPEVHRRWRGWLLGVGLLLGVPMHVAALIVTFAGGAYAPLSTAPHMIGAIAVALVYLTLLTGWAQTDRAVWLQDRLKAVGRLALTNYLMQTVICTTIFYSFGFGLYATYHRPATLLVVLGIWVFQLTASLLYLKVFRIGPVEWVWRSLAHWQRQPFLKKA
jgi:uncharacterized protein